MVAIINTPLSAYPERELRRLAGAVLEDGSDIPAFISFVLQSVCGFGPDTGSWQRGSQVGPEWTRRAVTGEAIRPRRIWRGKNHGLLLVFVDAEKRLGIGRGRRTTSQVLQWLRQGTERLALLTNGRQWRLMFAGLDFDAWAEWDLDLWFEEGGLSPQVSALRTLLSPTLWTPADPDAPPPLLQAILDTRKGQAELSAVLGERVREAVEVLVQAHGHVLRERCAHIPTATLYRAAVRVVMRLVVILFAESRDLLPRDSAIYHATYGLTGLLEDLTREATRGPSRLARSWSAWPRVLALFRLIHQGSHHEALPVPAYGGELFAPASASNGDALEQGLHVFESACFEREVMSDTEVLRMLDLITRTRVKLRQGRSSTWVPAPVDFSDLSSEYIGILYEGLLDFELKTAPPGDPVIFLSVGNQPALPLSRLEAMDDRAIENLLEKMKDTNKKEEAGTEEAGEEAAGDETVSEDAEPADADGSDDEPETGIAEEEPNAWSDERHATRTRAEDWARRAVAVGKLARKPKGPLSPEKQLAYEEAIGRKARELVTRVILPGEWYLVRWGGTRKGAGTFYTRPGLAVPTVHRTLGPLCYEERGIRNEERGIRNEERGIRNEERGIRNEERGIRNEERGVRNEERGVRNEERGVRNEERGIRNEDGRGVEGNEGFSRIGGMATGYGVVRRGILGGGQAAGAGTVRSGPSVEEGGGLGPVEYCGGAQPAVNGRLSTSSSDGSGLGGRGSDATAAGGTYGVDSDWNGFESDEPVRRMHEDAGHPHRQDEIGGRNEEEGTRNEEEGTSYGAALDPRSSLLIPPLDPPLIPPLVPCSSSCSSFLVPCSSSCSSFLVPCSSSCSSFLIPKNPDAILSIKVCDPACGSGTFAVAALRYLTDALYASLHHHDRIVQDGERAVVRLLSSSSRTQDSMEERLGEELLPCRPEDPLFEQRLKAVLRRHIVERCIYGVDLDPLAVELCRLSLWIETMDPELPFSFLDHKIKCGNSLVGAWFDQFQHYPVMAWKNREGGDKNHTNGVHFKKEARTQAIKVFVKDTLTPDLRLFLQDQKNLFREDVWEKASKVHEKALATLMRLHDLPVHDSAERSRIYREELIGSDAYQTLKMAMDIWCACWFWPADRLDHAPLPTTLAAPSEETLRIARQVAEEMRFFHWELEFPDVFAGKRNEKEGIRNEEQGIRDEEQGIGIRVRETDSPCNANRCSGAFSHNSSPLFLVPNSSFLHPGFDAMLGNPPWETLQPNSKEFFSNIDPLYRSYGKQEALRYQVGYFSDGDIEHEWLKYTAGFASDSNWMKFAASAFGDPEENTDNAGRFSITRGKENALLHDKWRSARRKDRCYASPAHPFCHRGEGKAYTYKLFLEQAHALLRNGGRMGFIVPSGLYSDHGTGALRRLFLDQCRWEWLFGFENRDKVFEIDSRFKFNPVIIEKGGRTEAIRTAFMRRKLEDWERAETLATSYSRAQVERFSPRSLAILEIQSPRDLEILEKIYANSVLLGDDGPDGWGIKYAQGDFNMTNDSKLFPPRPKWEAEGYRPDEYSRWLKGDWRPIGELWGEAGIRNEERGKRNKERGIRNEEQGVRREALGAQTGGEQQLEDWLFDTTATPEERAARARFVHGHLLKPGDVQRTNWRVRCAQPPYDALPIPRADIPPGIVLSREADAWIREEAVEDTALPLYEGRMIGQFDFSQKGWVSGKGRGAVWEDILAFPKDISPQYLMSHTDFMSHLYQKTSHMPIDVRYYGINRNSRLSIIDVTSSTNARTTFTSVVPTMPHGHSAPVLLCHRPLTLSAVMNSLVFDWVTRLKQSGLHLVWAVLEELPLAPNRVAAFARAGNAAARLTCISPASSLDCIRFMEMKPYRIESVALMKHERLRMRALLDPLIAVSFGAEWEDAYWILRECDLPLQKSGSRSTTSDLDPKGFWRVDKDKDPELRHTVLTLIAFHDLEEKIRECGGDRDKGIEAFLNQNNGEGWMLPETLRLADYGLGHDERAKVHQPVASRLGPRFYDWQLVQSSEESWRECHVHARNLLGERGYLELLGEVLASAPEGGWREALMFACALSQKENLLYAVEAALGALSPESWSRRLDEARSIMAERGFTLDPDDRIQLLFGATGRAPEGKRQDALKACKALLERDGLRTVMTRLLALEPTTPDGPWHTLLRESLEQADYRALVTALETQARTGVAEPSASYDVTKMSQGRLFD